jgi:hypothetical protein
LCVVAKITKAVLNGKLATAFLECQSHVSMALGRKRLVVVGAKEVVFVKAAKSGY